MSSATVTTSGASESTGIQKPAMPDDLHHWFLAAQQGDEDYIRGNISRFALKRNHEGYTALMLAAKYDIPEVISILVDKEGGEQTAAGLTALALQITSGHPINLELFAREGNIHVSSHVDPMFLAAMFDNIDALQFIVQNMGDSTSGESLYLLDICIEYNSVCCFEYLMTTFTNIPSFYINKLISIVEKRPNVDQRIISILQRYKPSLTSVNRSATTPPRTKKKSDPVPLVGSSLKRSVSATIDPNSQESSSPDAVLGKLQPVQEIQMQDSMLPPQTTSPLTMADIAPLHDQYDDHPATRDLMQRCIVPQPRVDPAAAMILSTTPSLPLTSNVDIETGLDTASNLDLLKPTVDKPKAEYVPPPGGLHIEESTGDDPGCRDNHRCCIDLACFMMKCDDLEQNNTCLYEQNIALHTEIGELKQKVIRLEAKIEQQNADNEALKKTLEETKSASTQPALLDNENTQSEANLFDLHDMGEPMLEEGNLVGKLQMYIMKTRKLQQENRVLKQKIDSHTARIHALERENTMKGRLNQLLTEDNKRSREQSRCTSVISRSESVLSPNNTFMDSMAVGLEDSIMDMITSKLTDKTKLESNILRRKVAELRTDMSQMLEDIMIISNYSVDLLPLSYDGGVYTANLRERATRLERQANTDSVKILFKRHADLAIDCMTYLKSIRDELRPDEEDLPESRSKSRNRSKSKAKTGRASSRSLFGAILHKMGLGGED